MHDIYTGKLVRLSAMDPAEDSKAFARWGRDSEFNRLLDSGVASITSQATLQKLFEKELEDASVNQHWFSIRKLEDDTLLGNIDLYVYNWSARDAFVGLGIGERTDWGKGYGTDVMNVMLRYAFTEVSLYRVTLTVFEYNPRAIRSYEKVGFRHEGRLRQALHKEGKRWDLLFMGILREEWLERNSAR